MRLLLAAGAILAATGTHAACEPAYRDLNHNGRLDVYEDRRRPIPARVDDLLSQMTLEEKVGALLHGTLPAVDSPFGASSKGYDLATIEMLIAERRINSMITRLAMPPAALAAQNNAVQRLAEHSRLGIPVTISTDPRNHFEVVSGASVSSNGFSQWPEPLGFAAIGDANLVRRFGAIAAHEYRAVGIQMALSPQADLASEPQWPRNNATFGADPVRVSALAGAYVEGFQGGRRGVTPQGVATVTKHWVGYGAEPEGFDAHNAYGRSVKLDNRSFRQHLRAFDGPLAARTAGMMPTYAIVEGVDVDGQPLEKVGAGFSEQLLKKLLRAKRGYDGLIISDWGITNDCPAACSHATADTPQTPMAIGMPWGVETLSQEERFAKGVLAGVDQFGGADDPTPLLAAVQSSKLPISSIDGAVRRVLRLKFQLGLFDNPYVDAASATQEVGSASARAQAEAAQRRAQVVLENRGGLLPLAPAQSKVWLYGIDAAAARAAGLEPVTRLDQAEIALIRVQTPAEKLHPHNFFGAMQNEGRLDFRDGDPGYEAIKAAGARLPTIVAVDMDRPTILSNIQPHARAMLALFGASDAALLDVVTGKVAPNGRLPFELPRSMSAVKVQNPAVANDTVDPLYRADFGLDLAR